MWAEVRDLLFGSGGLVPEVMNSVEWRSKFWAIQNDVSRLQGGHQCQHHGDINIYIYVYMYIERERERDTFF